MHGCQINKQDGKCDTLSGLLEAVKRLSANLTESAKFSFEQDGGGRGGGVGGGKVAL